MDVVITTVRCDRVWRGLRRWGDTPHHLFGRAFLSGCTTGRLWDVILGTLEYNLAYWCRGLREDMLWD